MPIQDRSASAREISDQICQIFLEAGKRIDTAIEAGEILQITKLSKELSEQFSTKEPEMYLLLRMFVSKQVDIKAKQGPNGGIVKVSIGSTGSK